VVDSEADSHGKVRGVDGERYSSSEDLTLWKEGTDAAPPSEDPRIGRVIAERYRIEGLLGEGGMGRVYRAIHVHMHKEVALKILRPEMMVVPGILARFEREAIAAGRISHPNVVAATDFGRIDGDGAFYLVLEYVNGRNLRHELKAGAFTVPRAIRIALQVCEALAAAHHRGVIHRDLKPENIMLVEQPGSDFVKVLDFGIAKLSDPVSEREDQKTRVGLVMGTPRYMSPEQGAGAAVDHRTDLYSLGIILYEMLSGQPPFGGGGVNAVLSQHLATAPPPLPAHVDAAVCKVVFHLLEKDANARPSSARDALVSLRRAQRETIRPTAGRLAVAQNVFRQTIQRVSVKTRPVRSRVLRGWLQVWRWLTSRAPWFRMFERRVSIGERSFPIAGILGSIVVVALAAMSWSGGENESLSHVSAPGVAATVGSPSTNLPTTNTTVREELDDLLAIPVYKRDRQQWLAIASGHAGLQEWKQSVAAYRNALQLEPRLKEDRQLLQQLRALAERDEVYEAVANIALNLLGEPGMDLMYDLWLTTRNDESKAVISAHALKNLGIFRLRSASRSLRVALALQFAKVDECPEIDKILTDALEYADERAVSELVKLRQTTGCGVSKKRDCYACIRPREKELDRAIERAESRRAPRFDGREYVPAK
jgi:eukaryotic-like serine/threonine-protein kinase